MRSKVAAISAVSLLAACLACSGSARADEVGIINQPGEHPPYVFEAEPHADVGFGGPFIHGDGQLGLGFRGSVVIVQNGFVKTINNNVAIGFGADFFFKDATVVFIPIVMQWNFFVSTHWSVFGEPGLGFAAGGNNFVNPVFDLGGRYHFTDKIALTMRLGYPAVSVGVSFFL